MRPVRRLIALALLTLAGAVAQADVKDDIRADLLAGRWEQADARLDAVLREHPDNALAHYWRAQAKYHLGQHEAARAAAVMARELDPSEKFADDKALLARMLGQPAVRAAQLWVVGAVLAFFAVVFGLGWRMVRSMRAQALSEARERWPGELKRADKRLTEALAACEDPQGHAARVAPLRAEMLAQVEGMATRQDFTDTAALVAKMRDMAADLRGEERPSDRALRLAPERQRNARRTVAAARVAAGAAGAIYAGRSLAADRDDDEGSTSEPESGSAPDVDVGGDNAGADDWGDTDSR